MKWKSIFNITVLLTFIIVVTLGSMSFQSKTHFEPSLGRNRNQTAFLSPNMGCSVIYAADDEFTFGGNNEDYSNPFAMAWFLPPEEGKFGWVYFGYEGFIWGGGMNDQGLFFDAMAVAEPIMVDQAGKPRYDGSLPDKVMAECDRIDCVIEIFSKFHSFDTWYHQFLFGDAHGNSVIIEPLNFIRNETPYQVGTNFYQSRVDIPSCSYCTRYQTAIEMFENADTYSVKLIRDILDAVHIDTGSPTIYSQVYDLKTNTVYLYFFHDFKNPVVFQLDEELAKGKHAVFLSDLFPGNQAYLDWAQPEKERVKELRSTYTEFEGDSGNYDSLTGKFVPPPEMGLPYPYYTIAIEADTLLLQIYPDKAWFSLTPLSETTYFHVSSFSHFEITFLSNNNGDVNQFLYAENGAEYTFERFDAENPNQITAIPTLSATATAAHLTPTETATVFPSKTPELQKPSVTPTEKSPTATHELPTPVVESQPSKSSKAWWIIPTAALVLIVGWYLIRRRQ